jgi:hypothetical protein
MPTCNGIEGAQPSFVLIRVLSLLRPRTPFGASTLYVRLSFGLVKACHIWAKYGSAVGSAGRPSRLTKAP